MSRLTKFVRSSQLLWTGKAPRKFSRWLTLCRLSAFLSGKVLNFDVQYLHADSLRLLYDEIFAREEYLFESSTAKPVIFDCGANIGMATLFFKWLYPESTVLSFEADPTTFRVLQRNIQENHLPGVSAHNVALWNDDGSIPFFVREDEPGSLLMSTMAGRTAGREIRVDARRLSSFIDGRVDLLKLDVEGAEGKVICDLLESGKIDAVQKMIIEYHHHIPHETPHLGSFLAMLEQNGWNYQLSSWFYPPSSRDLFQDVQIYAYR
ncbi:MAG TPA: FkbM family methyltransferase [Terriglobales bacterium]|nr:FkbM family methyltransferase [Terriglobales bacterium]